MESRGFPFISVARRFPDRPALRLGARTVAYRELDELSGALAARIAPGRTVAVTGRDRLDHVVGLLAALRAGATYLPLDREAPEERNRWIREDAGATLALTDGELLELVAPVGPVGPVAPVGRGGFGERRGLGGLTGLGTPDGLGGPPNEPDQGRHGRGTTAGYLVYTSGTTGRPKGVHVPLPALNAHLAAAVERFGLTEDDVVLHFARPAVDVAVEQVLTALSSGACVVVPERQLLAPVALLELLDAEGVTVANVAAGYFEEVVAALREGARAPRTLRLMISGSDRLHPDAAAGWWAATGVPLLNAYGPTETVVTATVHEQAGPAAGEGDTVPIGRPLGDRRAYVLDDRLRPVEPGESGELYLGGSLLATGYHGRPGLTAGRFVADPFAPEPGARMYRTGDLVRRSGTGDVLEFVGRADHQVKIRGFRVEPGEIEQVLAGHPGVAGAVVVAHQGRLAAYVTGTAPDAAELRAHLAERLPEYMVPATVTPLAAFPLTAGGKVDRAALPEPPARPAAPAARRRPPRTPAEQLIAAVWADVLGVPEIGADDNFFHLGGDSLTAVRVVGRVFDAFGMVSPYTIFDAPTLAEFAAAVSAAPGAGERPALQRTGATEAPLSDFQRGLWVLDQWNPGAPTYNVPWVFRFAGPVDPELLRRALAGVVDRHEVLRTTFELGEEGPRQVVHLSPRPGGPGEAPPPSAGGPGEAPPPAAGGPGEAPAPAAGGPGEAPAPAAGGPGEAPPGELPFTVVETTEAALDDLIAEAALVPFDLETGPLVRARLYRTGVTSTLLLLFHHIVWDEGSLPVLEAELGALYESLATGRPAGLPELPVQYADYSSAQHRDGTAGRQLDYWREQLRDAPAGPALPTDRPRPGHRSFRGAFHRFAMPRPVAEAVRALARSEDATPFMVLLAGLALTLHRRTGQRDLVLGAPVSVRGRAELDALIGYFVNLLPLRVRLGEGMDFRELIRHVREVAIGGYRHQEAPFDSIVGAVMAERPDDRTEDRNPLCQVLLELHPLDTGPLTIGGTEVTRELHSNPVSRFDLSISVDDRGTDFTGRFEYDSDLFDPATMAGLCDAWLGTLAAAVEAPVHRLFEDRAAGDPHALALIHGEDRIDYGTLNERANRLAHHLGGRGIGRGDTVAVLTERGPELVVALLAALKAGAAYTLLDPDFPAERLARAAADCGAALLVTHGNASPPFPVARHLDLDAAAAAVAARPAHDPGLPVTGADLACVMFTSGSTGRPKGVAVPHRALTTTYLGQDYARFGPDEVWLQCSPVSWDAFALELYGALAFGGVCVLQPGQRPDPQTVAELTRRHGVTQLQLSASLFNFLLEELPETYDDLRVAFTAGERASVTHVGKALEQHPDLVVANGYGPVESLGLTTCHRVTRQDAAGASIPIGHPLHGKAIHVLDEALRPVPDGATGELYASGGGLALGYVGRPGLTAERFVASPFGAPGERLYRTGDLGHRTAEGLLEITGRTDDQVKIRGFRVEPGEIEDALTRHPSVREAAVTVHEPAPGDRRLAAYVTTAAGTPVADPETLLDHLSALLPEHMVPATLDVLDALPLNPNGKVDRRALPAPAERSAAAPADPLTPEQRLVADAVRAVLGLAEDLGPDADFFRVGGNSLAAVRVAMRLSQQTGTRVPPQAVFRGRTVGAIAERMAA
ncbi:non-ribosomal peptide synthetase [Streptomyces tirandamycinicus]|uniref:Non-ribosomal peptide synthetase n=2 Tax=Streptomyces tirandamycinicus TaxID=2174846 RepID=A0A2S1T0C9_9ACTN|nr:non-ribosomal peptide synthetase [Streptomyces tirandamycinicus]